MAPRLLLLAIGADDGWPLPLPILALLVYAFIALLVFAIVKLWRRRSREILLAGFSVLLILAATEFVLRQTGLGAQSMGGIPSREYHHLNRRDADLFIGRLGERRLYVRTNEDGFRVSYSRAEFRAHATRIAVLGDSYVFGFLVNQEHALPHRLEGMLRERLGREDVAVLNAGIVSSSPLLQARLFEGIVRHYEPKLVVQVLDPTDIGDDHGYAGRLIREGDREVFDVPDPPRDFGRLAERLSPVAAVLGHPFEALGRSLGSEAPRPDDYYDFEVTIDGQRETDRYFIYRHPLAATRSYFEATLSHVRELAAAVRESGGRFVLVVAPRYHHWSRRECPDNWESRFYATDEPHQFEMFRFFAEARARVDFPIVSLLPLLRRTQEFPLVFDDDPHWNPAGHAFVARVIAHVVQELGLLEQRAAGPGRIVGSPGDGEPDGR